MIRRTATALLLLATGPAPLVAQSIHGQLVEQTTFESVPGAFVVLIDAAGIQRDAALTDEDGRFVLDAPGPGSYVLGLDRIGYLSVRTDPIPLVAGQLLRYRLVTVVEPVELSDIAVEVAGDCTVRPAEGRAIARVWEEARKALNATAFTQRMGLLRYTVVARERNLDPYDLRVRDESSRRRTGVTRGSPYVSLPPAVLAQVGYARFEGEEQVYYAPDAVTLLSDPFLDGHCLRLAEPTDDAAEEWIGLAFEPVAGRQLPDIRGTLWLDEESAELRRLDFEYVNLPGPHARYEAGGRVEFERLPSGEWIVRRWRIRMPVLRLPRTGTYSHLTMDPNERVPTLISIQEDAGEVAQVEPTRRADRDIGEPARRVWAEPIPTAAAFAAVEAEAEVARSSAGGLCPVGAVARGTAVVAGVARDAATGEPLPGTRVTARVADETLDGLADRDGRWTICGVRPGAVDLRATFPGRAATATVDLAPDAVVRGLALELEGEGTLAAPDLDSRVEVEPAPGLAGAIVGRVLDDATGRPLPGAQVTLGDTGIGTTTDADGAFRLTVPSSGAAAVTIAYLGYMPATVEVALADDAGVRLDAQLVPTAIVAEAVEAVVPGEDTLAERGRAHARYMLTREDIPEHTTRSLPALLAARFGGVRVRGRSVTGGCPVIELRDGRVNLVVIDGQPFYDTCILDGVLATDVERVEVIPGVAGALEYGRQAAGGVIVVTTRRGD